MKVYASIRQEVSIDPIDVLEKLDIIPYRDWIVKSSAGKYIHMTEQSAGSHSFDDAVGEVSQETYDLYMAQKLLVNHFKNKKTLEELKQKRILPAIEF